MADGTYGVGMAQKQGRSYPNNDPYGNDYYGYYGESKPDWGSAFLTTLFSILPSAFEVHTGFTPGMMFGPLSLPPYDGGFLVRHRFSCTFDVGARLIIPIWRFNLYGDFTYHCYITDNFGFRYGDFRPTRSYMGVGVGLSFNF